MGCLNGFAMSERTVQGTTHNFWEFACNNMNTYFSPNFHCHLWSSHLGLVYNNPSDFAIFRSTHWSLLALACLVPVAILLGFLQWTQNSALSTGLSFREHIEIAGDHVRRVGRVGNGGRVLFGQELPHNERGVCSCIVVVQQPVSVLPHLRLFAPHIFPQLFQNLAVKIPVDSLTRWNKLLMRNSLNVKKNYQHWLDVAVNLAYFFRSQRGWHLPLWRLLLCFQVIILQPWFIISYDPGQEVRIMSNCFLQLGAHLNLMVLLVIVQETRNKLLQFVSCSVHLLDCVDMTVQRDYRHHG